MHVARGALDEAEQELKAGAVAQDRQQRGSRFGTSGLHFLLGLVRLARGDEAAALREFERELALEDTAHIYTREVCAHTSCALGAVRLRQDDPAAALVVLDQALKNVAGYPLALVAALAVRGVSGDGSGSAAAGYRHDGVDRPTRTSSRTGWERRVCDR